MFRCFHTNERNPIASSAPKIESNATSTTEPVAFNPYAHVSLLLTSKSPAHKENRMLTLDHPTTETTWEAPGPGPWRQDRAHLPASISPMLQAVYAGGINRASMTAGSCTPTASASRLYWTGMTRLYFEE